MAAWPPRLPGQPIFYPVCNEQYATMIARERSGVRCGLHDPVPGTPGVPGPLQRPPGRRPGHPGVLDLADELPKLNANIIDVIEVVAEFR